MPGSREGRLALLTPLRRPLLAPAVLLALVAAALPAAAAGRGLSMGLPTARIARVEDQIVGCTNRARTARGLPALRRSSVLRHAAKYHAHNMLRYNFFRHDDVFGQSPADRVARFGRRGVFRWVGENIAVGNWSGADVCRAWMG